jgi:DNA-binding PadR family transcriptional regulator
MMTPEQHAEQTAKRHELTKLWILQFLSEPENAQHGQAMLAIRSAVWNAGGAQSENAVRARLYEMRDAGLIENRDVNLRNSNARKPYFITEKGREHLAEAKEKPIFPIKGEPCGWAEDISTKRAISPRDDDQVRR